MTRERIDWHSLQPLPLRRPERANLEAHADRKFHRHKAKHKGRCHFHAYQKRQRAKHQAAVSAASADAEMRESIAYRAAVRAYWRGEADRHP